MVILTTPHDMLVTLLQAAHLQPTTDGCTLDGTLSATAISNAFSSAPHPPPHLHRTAFSSDVATVAQRATDMMTAEIMF